MPTTIESVGPIFNISCNINFRSTTPPLSSYQPTPSEKAKRLPPEKYRRGATACAKEDGASSQEDGRSIQSTLVESKNSARNGVYKAYQGQQKH